MQTLASLTIGQKFRIVSHIEDTPFKVCENWDDVPEGVKKVLKDVSPNENWQERFEQANDPDSDYPELDTTNVYVKIGELKARKDGSSSEYDFMTSHPELIMCEVVEDQGAK